MANRTQPLSALVWVGTGALALVLTVTLAPLVAIAVTADDGFKLRAADWAAIRFTLLQAFLSASLSLAIAIPLARAVARRRFIGRGIFISLMGAPFILPVIVAVIGLIASYRHNGWLARPLPVIGLDLP